MSCEKETPSLASLFIAGGPNLRFGPPAIKRDAKEGVSFSQLIKGFPLNTQVRP